MGESVQQPEVLCARLEEDVKDGCWEQSQQKSRRPVTSQNSSQNSRRSALPRLKSQNVLTRKPESRWALGGADIIQAAIGGTLRYTSWDSWEWARRGIKGNVDVDLDDGDDSA